ncbi:MAG TPA: lytic transglycosylase domain-containing protein [Anaerolineae bacterium]|nr:lytic transglycosylase domain-containing protein [Anaerolineae bacterium]
MIEAIFTQLQSQMYESVLKDLRQLLSGVSMTGLSGSFPILKARTSEFDALIDAAADKYNLDPTLLKAVAHAESNLSAEAISTAGAKGLMQLMDSTAAMLGVTDSFDPLQNVEGGARYLQQMLARYQGNEALALAAYNAGPGAVDQWGGIPPYAETQVYVPKVLQLRGQCQSWEG